MEGLTEEEKRALRGSKFAPLPCVPPSPHQPRQAHPCGPMKTNKAAALAKFLERKLQEPNGLASVDPKLVELAVKNAKDAVNPNEIAGGTSSSGRTIHHVNSFGDSEESAEEKVKISTSKKHKKKRKKSDKKKNKKMKNFKDATDGNTKRPKKKMKQ